MKTGLSVLAVAAAFLSVASAVSAADLINEDNTPYVVLVNGEQEVTVEAGSNVMGICDQCTIQLVDGVEPALNVVEDSNVVISDGKMSVE